VKSLILAIAVLLFTPTVLAELLDDLLSPQQQFDINFQWTYQNDSDLQDDTQLNSLTARAQRVEIRLNTSRHIGKHARIFIGLPVTIRGVVDSSALRMSWKTNGVFADGSITAGNRSKLFEGKITQNVLGDVFDILFQIDARQVFGALRFKPLYEIEILDP
jgi:hypothetical protein